MLPPGLIGALKGHQNGLVTVGLCAATLTAMTFGVTPWAAIIVMAICFGGFHTRCCATESHERNMAQGRLAEASLNVEAIKVRHRELLLSDQPMLPLTGNPGRMARSLSDEERKGR
jgi:hypothetical protein